jgi:hypothetical protein
MLLIVLSAEVLNDTVSFKETMLKNRRLHKYFFPDVMGGEFVQTQPSEAESAGYCEGGEFTLTLPPHQEELFTLDVQAIRCVESPISQRELPIEAQEIPSSYDIILTRASSEGDKKIDNSEIWSYFKKIVWDTKSQRRDVLCLTPGCKESEIRLVGQNAGTTNLWNHLKRFHNSRYLATEYAKNKKLSQTRAQTVSIHLFI